MLQNCCMLQKQVNKIEMIIIHENFKERAP